MTGLVLILIVLAIALLVWVASRGSRDDSVVYKRSINPPKQVPRSRPPPKTPTISWIPVNQEVTVAGYKIRCGFIYTGHTYRTDSWSPSLDPSMIDLDLQVRRPKPEGTLPDIDYWPSYVQIQPECRDTYLRWLAGGRSDSSIDIGYVFLFFYGLERRLLVDAKTSAEAKAEAPSIVAEVKRLLDLYGENSSFRRYATKFMEVCKYLYIPEKIQPEPPKDALRGEFPLSLKMALSDLSIAKKPIPAEWALSWLEHSVEFYPRTSVRRCRDEFVNLFCMRYSASFGDGMVVKPNKTPLRFEYRPASSGLQSSIVLEAKDAPDITVLKWPLSKLKEIAESCSDDLDAYSRSLRKDPEPNLLALGLLPSELLIESRDSQLARLKAWLLTSLAEDPLAAVETKALLDIFALHDRPKIQKTDATGIAQLLAKLGYGIEPDPRFTLETMEPDGKCVLFKAEGRIPSSPTEAYKTASLMLRLCSTVVSADGTVSRAEETLLEQHIESVLDLSPAERQRLSAYMHWLMLVPPDLVGLKRRLAAWSTQQRQSAVRLLLLVANADNHIDPAEVKILTKTYRLLELDPETLFSDIHAIQTRPEDLPATILRPDSKPSGRPIPKPSEASSSRRSSKVALDIEAIERTLRETHQVQQLLASVFAEEEVGAVSTSPPKTPRMEAKSVLGLDSIHSSLLARLLTRPDWPRTDLDALCTEYQVLPDGAIDTINTAAIEQHGDLLFDFGDSLQLNHDIAKELQV